MDQKNILPRGIAKPIEQQPDGTWIVRHHFRVVGTSENGEELVTFASSEYPEKPTLQQIQRSIDRYMGHRTKRILRIERKEYQTY